MTKRRWRVVIASPAARDIDRLPMKVAAAAIEAIQTIASDPRRPGKRLRLELSGQWTARRGPYRLIYTIDDETSTIRITAVAHRADVYRLERAAIDKRGYLHHARSCALALCKSLPRR